VGKANTEAAGAYPEDLTDEIAKRIIETWKRILNLEWLRYQMQQKAKQISELQVKWLSNGKRLYEESSPTVVNPLSKDPKNCIGSKAKPRKRTRWLQEAEAGRRVVNHQSFVHGLTPNGCGGHDYETCNAMDA